jgi:hypothetical protein
MEMALQRTTVCFTLRLVASLLLAVTSATPGWAALGEPEASVSVDSGHFGAAALVAARPSFTVHELRTPAGTVIREFVALTGEVFAVSWQGPYMPSMSQLLGQNFQRYATAPRSAGSSRSRLLIDQPDLVVHAGGHIRSYTGVAYLPRLLPPGVSEEQLQ